MSKERFELVKVKIIDYFGNYENIIRGNIYYAIKDNFYNDTLRQYGIYTGNNFNKLNKIIYKYNKMLKVNIEDDIYWLVGLEVEEVIISKNNYTTEQDKILQQMIGRVVTHFKDKDYLVLGVIKHTETEEDLVVYKALYGDNIVYARPKDMFLSEVDKEKYPEVKHKYRFELKE